MFRTNALHTHFLPVTVLIQMLVSFIAWLGLSTLSICVCLRYDQIDGCNTMLPLTPAHNMCRRDQSYRCLMWINLSEFSLNYTKFAILAIKDYVGKSKINEPKKVTSSGDWTWDLLWSTLMPAWLIYLGSTCKTETFSILI